MTYTTSNIWYANGNTYQSIRDERGIPTGYLLVNVRAHSALIEASKAELASWDGVSEGRFIRKSA